MKSILLLALLGCSLSSTSAVRSSRFGGIRLNTYALDYANVMISDEDVDHSKEFFDAGDQGMTPNGVEYVRTIPEQYNEESPNKFINNILTNFALE